VGEWSAIPHQPRIGEIMAVFNKNTLTQVSGFDNQIIAGELVYQQQAYWNLTLANDAEEPLDLTLATIDAQIIRRQLSNVRDSRYGLAFDIGDYTPTPTPIPLTITNKSNLTGTFTLVFDAAAWNLMANDIELNIADVDGIGFSGRITISFPQVGSTPAYDMIIFLLFLVRSDAIVKN
jgi:hypothetical protein